MTTKHTYDTALAAAVARGYGGEYAQQVARDMVGMTDVELAQRKQEYADAAHDATRRGRYARAAEREPNPRRRAHFAAVADGDWQDGAALSAWLSL